MLTLRIYTKSILPKFRTYAHMLHNMFTPLSLPNDNDLDNDDEYLMTTMKMILMSSEVSNFRLFIFLMILTMKCLGSF